MDLMHVLFINGIIFGKSIGIGAGVYVVFGKLVPGYLFGA
jgi:hypothetical protein